MVQEQNETQGNGLVLEISRKNKTGNGKGPFEPSNFSLVSSKKRKVYMEMTATIEASICFTLKVPNTNITINQVVNVKEKTSQNAIKEVELAHFKKLRNKIQETGVEILKRSKALPLMYLRGTHDALDKDL